MKPIPASRVQPVPLAGYVAWIVALGGMLGSLYYSEIRDLTPCLLCWYQRIAMYPLVAIIAVGILRRDSGLPFYVWPLSIIGMGIAAYHYLLQIEVLPEAAATCQAGVSCTDIDVEYLGFITIPFLSFVAFAIITACMVIYRRRMR